MMWLVINSNESLYTTLAHGHNIARIETALQEVQMIGHYDPRAAS